MDYARLSEVLPASTYPDNVREVVYLDKFMNPINSSEVIDFARNHNINYLVKEFNHPSQSLTIAVPGKVERVFLATPFSKEFGQTADFIHWYGNINGLIKINRFGSYFEVLQIVR